MQQINVEKRKSCNILNSEEEIPLTIAANFGENILLLEMAYPFLARKYFEWQSYSWDRNEIVKPEWNVLIIYDRRS